MTFSRRMVRPCVAGACAFVVGLSGCTTSPPPLAPTPSMTASTLNLSDEEALAAATTAYREFLKVVDAVLADGGTNPERIHSVASGQAADDFLLDAEEFRKRGVHTTGRTSFDSVRAQGPTRDQVTIYVCVDVSNIDVLNAEGVSQVESSRLPRTPYVVSFTGTPLLVSKEILWDGEQFC